MHFQNENSKKEFFLYFVSSHEFADLKSTIRNHLSFNRKYYSFSDTLLEHLEWKILVQIVY